MKHFLLFFLFASTIIWAQNNMGFGAYQNTQDGPCLTDVQRAAIQTEIAANVAQLKAQGKLPEQPQEEIVLLGWPVIGADGQTDYGYHGVSNFVDLDPNFPNQLLDYNCGTRSYDLTSGYNHQGIDMFTWPFGWYRMDNDEVIVVAAAEGTIVGKADGNADRSCGFNGSNWNAVFVQHTDGSTAWYGHLKKDSTTPKTIGETVTAGEYLGVVGSSGNSTGPHLHFELYDSTGMLQEPYSGTCNNLNSESWWADQRPYYDSAINRLMTHSAAPIFPACPQQEIVNESNNFMPGEPVYFAAYFRDQLNTQETTYTVFQPDNSVFQTWTHFSNATHYAASYWYWWWTLSPTAPSGTWTFQVEFEGETYTHLFTVGVPASINDLPSSPHTYNLEANYPNPFNPSTTIGYSLEKAGNVQLKIYNALGQEVRLLINEAKPAGRHTVNWDGRDNTSKPVPGGAYFYKISSGKFTQTQKMILTK